jgi:energy-coupling factor transporter ATP-binding protein EcfA2
VSDVHSSDFFATANARFRSPATVARSFIPPEQFRRLALPAHTVMVGPRGSGKTTLLKMLTPEALAEAAQSKRFRLESGLQFTGVFIPSDIAWSKQLQTFSKWNLPEELSSAIFEASFTTSVLRSFAGSLHDRFKRDVPETWLGIRRIHLDAATESLIAESLADLWSLKLRVPSLRGLKAAAAERIVDLGRLAAQVHRVPGPVAVDERLLLGPLVPQLTLALDTLEALVPETAGEKWGLLFDELELAPAETRKSLIASMRSVDERLIFKLAIAPYASDLSDLVSAVAAMPGHDHEEIWLSYGHKAQAMEFSFELMRALVRERFGQDVSLESLLGSALFPADDEDLQSVEQMSHAQEDYVRDLYASDQTFRAYVRRVAGGLDELLASTGQKRSQNLRKILPIVIVRVAFRTPDDSDAARGSRRTRSRKNPFIYSGTTALATILEGNPRWIIGVLSSLLDDLPERVPYARQNAEIARTRNAFRAMLSTIPVPSSSETRRGLLSLLNLIGESFKDSLIVDDFNADPVASFTVDHNASPALIEALGSAVNAGAIVYVPDGAGAGLLSSMRGKRFRLSYLLATQYQLPLRLERAASLRSILVRNSPQTPLELFTDE